MRRLIRLVTLATLVAGLIGVWRQRREAAEASRPGAVRRRPAGLDDDAGLGPVARRLATWVPTRPSSRWGRAATTLWAAPLSAVGLVMGLLSGGDPRWDADLGCVVFERSAGVSGRILDAVGARANAMGQVVVVRADAGSQRLLAHEAIHVRQAERLGPLLFPAYVWLAARYGYANHPLERAARLGSR